MLAELLDRYKLRLYYLSGPRLGAAGDSEGAEQGIEQGVEQEFVAELHATRPTGTSTRLGAAVRTVLEDLGGSTPAAIVLLTDGINTEGPPLSDGAIEAARRGVPLYLVGLGDERPERDVKLSDLLVNDEVFVDDVVYFEAQTSATGYQGRQAQVVLRRQDRDHPAGDAPVLARTTVTLGADGQSQPVRLAHRPTQEGEFTYVLEVEPLEGESHAENNRLERTIRVRRETIRVLMVWAEPTYEYRYLCNMLKRDKSIELNVVLQNADRRHFEQDKAVLKDGFPAKAEDLARYDVVILGDADREAMLPSQIEHLVDFVEQPAKGGSLVVSPARSPCRSAGEAHRWSGCCRSTWPRPGPPIPSGRWRRLRRPAHGPWAGQPGVGAGRPAGRDCRGVEEAAAALLAVGGPGPETRGPGLGRGRAARGARPPCPALPRPAAAGDRHAIRRRRQGPVPRYGRDMALAFPRRRGLLHSLLGADDPLSRPVETQAR